jgi:hypothetical protein
VVVRRYFLMSLTASLASSSTSSYPRASLTTSSPRRPSTQPPPRLLAAYPTALADGFQLDYAQVEVDAGLTGDLYVDLSAQKAKRVKWEQPCPGTPQSWFHDYGYTGP